MKEYFDMVMRVIVNSILLYMESMDYAVEHHDTMKADALRHKVYILSKLFLEIQSQYDNGKITIETDIDELIVAWETMYLDAVECHVRENNTNKALEYLYKYSALCTLETDVFAEQANINKH